MQKNFYAERIDEKISKSSECFINNNFENNLEENKKLILMVKDDDDRNFKKSGQFQYVESLQNGALLIKTWLIFTK